MSFTLKQLSELSGATLQGDSEALIISVADLKSATATDASFLSNNKYAPLLSTTAAGVICISPQENLPDGKNYLISDDPSRTFQKIAEALYGDRSQTGFTSIHETAIIHETATIGENVIIAPYAVIDKDAHIGDNSYIGPFVYIGAGSTLGKSCHLYAHTVVREYCELGNHVILQPGAVIGSCGFGFTTNELGEHTKLEQLGNVIIEDDAEIGANTTIDRARFKTTRIGKGTKIDNLVQIAHNVEIGEHNLIAAQTGIAGTAKTGRNVMMGGQVGIVGHLEITDFVMIATRGGVSKSIKKPGRYAGGPVMTLADHNKNQVHSRKIESYAKRIEALEQKLEQLTSCN